MIRRVLPLLLVALFTGCPLIGVVADGIGSAFEPDPPRVTASWAGRARGVRSPATPADDTYEPMAEFGPEDDRDTNELDDLDGDEGLVQVHVKMGAGIFELEDQTTLADADVVIEGAGPTRTRLELHNEEKRSLIIKRAKKVELRDLTIVGYAGGGIFLADCPDVKIENVHFAGVDRGLSLHGSVATVESSVFAGCANGLELNGSRVTVRESYFDHCYVGIGGAGQVDCESSAFLDNHTAVKARLTRSSSFTSNLFFGSKQELGWSGRPRVASGNLTHRRDLGKLLDDRTNYPIRERGSFPESVRLPPGFDVPGVQLAIARGMARGEKNPESSLNDLAFDGALRYAKAATLAAKGGDLPSARAAIRVALRYWGKRPMSDAPEALIQLAELGEVKPLK